jgi:hypothetical protein
MEWSEKNNLEFVDKLLDALEAELGQLKDKPASWAELMAQINRLGTLYQSVRTGDDSSLQDR